MLRNLGKKFTYNIDDEILHIIVTERILVTIDDLAYIYFMDELYSKIEFHYARQKNWGITFRVCYDQYQYFDNEVNEIADLLGGNEAFELLDHMQEQARNLGRKSRDEMERIKYNFASNYQ